MSSPYKYDSSWKTQDLFKNYYTQASTNALFLKLDQSTPQVVMNGISLGNSSSYLRLNGETMELYVNDSLRQSWTTVLATAAPVYIADGVPMGLLIGLTYQT